MEKVTTSDKGMETKSGKRAAHRRHEGLLEVLHHGLDPQEGEELHEEVLHALGAGLGARPEGEVQQRAVRVHELKQELRGRVRTRG